MQPRKEHQRNYVTAVAGIFILLAVIGVITVAVFSFKLTASLLDNQRQKSSFENFLTPVVMFDPAPFADPASLDNRQLLLYSMWTVLSSDDVDKYSRSEENQTLLIPASDIDAAAYTLFRDRVNIKHETFADIQTTYFFNKEINSYEVPTYGFLYVPRPQVTEITKRAQTPEDIAIHGERELYDVFITSIPPDNAWNGIYKGDGTVFSSKAMVYVLEKFDGVWYLDSIIDPKDEGIYQNELVLGASGIVEDIDSGHE